jgi:hypothetical protein
MSVQFKKKEHILIVQIFASLCYLIVYIYKSAWSGVSIEVLEETKDILFINTEKKGKKIPFIYLALFIGLLFVCSAIFYDGPFSLLPLAINIILFTSTYFKNPKYIRWVMLLCGILWGVYNMYLGAYIILIGNALEVVSAIISIIRFKDIDNGKVETKRRTRRKLKRA